MNSNKKKKTFKNIAMHAALFAAAAFAISSCGRSSTSTPSTTTIPLIANAAPVDITASMDGSRLFVANNTRSTVSIIDSSTLNYIADIPVSCSPRHIAVSSDDKYLYVSHDATQNCKISPLGMGASDTYNQGVWAGFEGTKFSRIDLATKQVTLEVTDPEFQNGKEIAWDYANGFLYVTSYDRDKIGVITTPESATNTVSKIISNSVQKPVSAVLTSDAATLVVTNYDASGISLIDTTTKAAYAGSPWLFNIFGKPKYLALYPGSDSVLLTSETYRSIYRLDVSSPSSGWSEDRLYEAFVFASPNKPSLVAASSDGKYVLAVVSPGAGLAQKLYAIPWDDYANEIDSPTYVYTLGLAPSDIAIIGNYAYVTDESSSNIYKFKFTDSAQSSSTIYLSSSLNRKTGASNGTGEEIRFIKY